MLRVRSVAWLPVLAACGLAIGRVAAAQDASVTSEIHEMKQALEQQQQQIQGMRQELQQRDQTIQQMQQQLDQTRMAVSDYRSTAPAKPESKKDSAGGIHLTPGGFLEAASIFRSNNENADMGSTFGNIPFDGTANSHLSEFRGSARQSRLSLLADGKLDHISLSAYYEMDFLGAAPTANEQESNSFNLRQRQLWGQVEFDNGFSFLGGQAWSLLTTDRSGITARREMVPLTIDAQYAVGFNWARQWQARFTEHLSESTWLSFSVENPETTVSPTPPAGVYGFNTSPNATAPGSQFTLNNTPGAAGVSTDIAPDVVGKLAFEPGFGHYELKLLGRFFRDRFDGNNDVALGGGVGAAAILPATSKVDVILEALAGRGIGRYASGLGPDVTIKPDGSVVPIPAVDFMGGFEAHPMEKLDIYTYAGFEWYGQKDYQNAKGQGVGYGSPLVDLSGCTTETASPCSAQNRLLWQVQPGFWYRFYRGPLGTLQLGASYSFTHRNTFAGLNDVRPFAAENIVMTSFRYYLP